MQPHNNTINPLWSHVHLDLWRDGDSVAIMKEHQDEIISLTLQCTEDAIGARQELDDLVLIWLRRLERLQHLCIVGATIQLCVLLKLAPSVHTIQFMNCTTHDYMPDSMMRATSGLRNISMTDCANTDLMLPKYGMDTCPYLLQAYFPHLTKVTMTGTSGINSLCMLRRIVSNRCKE